MTTKVINPDMIFNTKYTNIPQINNKQLLSINKQFQYISAKSVKENDKT